MDLIEMVEAPYKNSPAYNVKFSIEPEAYKVPDGVDVKFGKSETELSGGTFINYQTVIINGEEFGFLEERNGGGLLAPMTTSFCFCIADCEDDDFEEVYEKYKDNPHFADCGESLQLCFATLKQFLEFHDKMKANNYQLCAVV